MKNVCDAGKLCVMDNGHYFACGDRPFFLLADTAWTLFQKLDETQAEIYLRNRKEKGFNAVLPVFDRDNRDVSEVIAEDNNAYWDRVKKIVSTAEDLGMYLGILPVWGHVVKNKHLRSDNTESYAEFIYKNFGQFNNIFWVVGGDCRGDTEYEVWDMLGSGLKRRMPDKIIGYHPFGRTSSSYWFQNSAWLDFHMFQSGHRRTDQRDLKSWDETESNEPWYGEENFRYVNADYFKKPLRPVLDGEPSYEQIPQGLHNPSEPYWQDHHTRRYAYWSVLAGAAGHVYGHNAVMQFYTAGDEKSYGAKETWDMSIHDVGSSHMRFLKNLMEEIKFYECRPMQEILADPAGARQEDNILAFGSSEYIVCYSYTGREIKIKGISDEYEAFWFDPVNGTKSYFGKFRLGEASFTPTNKKNMWNDWVLFLRKVN